MTLEAILFLVQVINVQRIPMWFVICFHGPLGRDVILKEEDLAILLDLLKPAATQWQTIGLALGFPNYELNTIQHTPLLIPQGLTGYFKEMMSQWLTWAPQNHPWPTLEALQLALQRSGHENLAVSLIPEFIQRLR